MSLFRTSLPSFEPHFQLNHEQQALSIGSCFAEHMAEKLSEVKISCHLNPFGILYHPQNIANCIDMSISNYQYSEKDLLQREEYWLSWWHHSQVFAEDKYSLIEKIGQIQKDLAKKIKSSDLFIFTFGSAYYYKHLKSGIPVGNCHKVSSREFSKQLSTVDEIVNQYNMVLEKLLAINPKANFIFTVSPVRHIKNGIIENNRSKAILHLAIQKITQQIKHAVYFPAYEIMIDDLRDYRFYKPDLLHPNEVAIDYIWDHFTKNLFTDETKRINEQLKSIQQSLAHRPFHESSEAHQSFLRSTKEKIRQLQENYSFLNFEEEIKNLEHKLN